MEIRRLGFYTELDTSPGPRSIALTGSVHDARRPVPEPDEDQVLTYLESGHVLVHVMEAMADVIDDIPVRRRQDGRRRKGDPDPRKAEHLLGCSSPVTDGLWVWRRDLVYYLANYHVALDGEFLTRVRAAKYRPPSVPEDVLREIGRLTFG